MCRLLNSAIKPQKQECIFALDWYVVLNFQQVMILSKKSTHILKSCNRGKSKHKSQQDYLLYQKIRERKKVSPCLF